ncbi:hypothetical protein SAMN05421780_104299 [Flexibacter flexilis DSM 6793]|uniref:Uncharacterized protein n=1 Tax=Flexibacter flexilis DSM 6793 TaxID=927664 RepID=A0A1I1ICX5_9BACT|nr:DUF4248 domain-containing protein [Flexibacter flexilis]SFC33522.1 hypothetical protein SAMN05421780_104299 [Flexibacter flexilis DSM 6793]
MNRTQFKTMSKGQVANAYQITVKTLNKRIKHIVNIGRKKLFTPKQVKDIVDELGEFVA